MEDMLSSGGTSFSFAKTNHINILRENFQMWKIQTWNVARSLPSSLRRE